jgi:hypothetical protein
MSRQAANICAAVYTADDVRGLFGKASISWTYRHWRGLVADQSFPKPVSTHPLAFPRVLVDRWFATDERSPRPVLAAANDRSAPNDDGAWRAVLAQTYGGR